MSSRQLKKLRAQEEKRAQTSGRAHADEANENNDGIDDDEDEADVDTRPRPKNVFAAFAALGDEGDDDDDEKEKDDDEADEQQPQVKDASDAARPAPKAGKKKKKKKKGKGGKPAAAAAATAPTAPDGLDEIDRALEELRLKEGAKAGTADQAGGPHSNNRRTLDAAAHDIRVSFADLRVLNELREVFGRDIVQAAAADDALGVPGRPRGEAGEAGEGGNPNVVMMDLESFLRAPPPPPRGMVYVGANGQRLPSAGGMAGLVAKRNPFIQWKDTWPRGTSGGLAMRQVTDAKVVPGTAAGRGVVEYAFVHSPAYVVLEDEFFTLVMMHNPQPLIQFLRDHPFHIASLIQISRVAKLQDQNASLAADLCERALFSFGRSTLSSFRQTLAEGRARLSFYRPENRQFLLAGYHYVRSLMARGTYRTALAWTKLFMSLMPHDEYALVLYAQALAVRAFEARWLVSYLGTPRNGSDEGEKEEGEEDETVPALRNNSMRDYIRQSLVPALLQTKDVDGAKTALARGMARLPWLYGALFQALGLDVPRAVWGVPPRDDRETLYTQLYVHLAKELWDAPQARALLREVADGLSAQPKVDAATLPPAPPMTLSLARFVYLDGTPALMALVPRDMLHAAPNYDFDPLPPAREANEFSNRSQVRPWIMAASDRQHGGHRQMPVLPDDFLMPGQLIEVEEADDDDDEDDNEYDEDDEYDDEFEVAEDEDYAEPAPTAADTPASAPRQSPGGSGGGGMPGAWFDDDA
ncbi:nulp1-pending protein [Sporothrix schenckii 1099-18]|uniref:Nulp1-pending protein n=2 Tax=Sporothrix schenckii TaxID=29908 RepID=U7PKW2_SPOS1|nr:nulp1-pending protein [Sporothrix schenckii 1099-18]ERS95551.1 hypothetical protein HMPREF1624_08067 [Sporothrix schenckii ATCC 58251]KJR86743.1 nulp1-pending protein [Sporothrix schenckii 1099-18]